MRYISVKIEKEINGKIIYEKLFDLNQKDLAIQEYNKLRKENGFFEYELDYFNQLDFENTDCTVSQMFKKQGVDYFILVHGIDILNNESNQNKDIMVGSSVIVTSFPEDWTKAQKNQTINQHPEFFYTVYRVFEVHKEIVNDDYKLSYTLECRVDGKRIKVDSNCVIKCNPNGIEIPIKPKLENVFDPKSIDLNALYVHPTNLPKPDKIIDPQFLVSDIITNLQVKAISQKQAIDEIMQLIGPNPAIKKLPEVGETFNFSKDGNKWIKGTLDGFIVNNQIAPYKFIRKEDQFDEETQAAIDLLKSKGIFDLKNI